MPASEFGYLPAYEPRSEDGGVIAQKVSKTQASAGDGVTINAYAGRVVLASETVAADAKGTAFTLTNDKILAGSVVRATALGTTGGAPVVVVNSVSAGSADFEVVNVGASSITDSVTMGFQVL